MLVSFNYAVTQALRREIETGMVRPENLPLMKQWAKFWYTWVSATFCNSYLATARENNFLPKTPAELQLLLFAYLLEKAMEELHHELNHRPDYVEITLQLILQLISES
jgi:maltose alpha-D-glucosyltransferase/alpha-amylase